MMKSRLLTPLIAILVSLTSTPANAQTAPDRSDAAPPQSADINRPVRDKWALIVGIGKFGNSKIPQLKFATKDAKDFYNYLIREAHFSPDHVRLLLNEKASQRRIMSELGSKFLARLARPDDMIVLFFSTHGSPSQMDLRGKNYIVAYDSDPEDLYASGIEMQKILESIQSRVMSDRVLLVLDACHSGGAGPDAKGIMRVANFDAEALAEGSGQMVICSSKTDEQSWESKRYQNGVFTKSLLEGLRANGNNTSVKSAFDRTRDLVANEVKEDHPGARQTPVMHTKWSGNDLIVAVKPAAPQRVPATVMSDLDPDSSQEDAGPGMSEAARRVSSESVSQSLSTQDKLILTTKYFSDEPDPKAAWEGIKNASWANFNNFDLYHKKAKILIQLGNYSKAEQTFKDVLVDDPNRVEAYLGRAYCYYKMKNMGMARYYVGEAQKKGVLLPKVIEFGD